MDNKIKYRYLILLIALGSIIGIGISFATAISIGHTSDYRFCGSCHEMGAFVESYKNSTHGGKNSMGIQAVCTDCHLPHDTTTNYLLAKVRTGLHDMWVHNFGDPQTVDWEANRKHRSNYVYDSGCIHCHTRLEDADNVGNLKALVAHRKYFRQDVKMKCVKCHENVGHHELGNYIKKNFPLTNSTENP